MLLATPPLRAASLRASSSEGVAGRARASTASSIASCPRPKIRHRVDAVVVVVAPARSRPRAGRSAAAAAAAGWSGRRGHRSGAAARRLTPPAALPECLFSVGTVTVLPLYALMIGFPRAELSARVMSSALPFAVMGCLYASAAFLSLQSAGAWALVNTFVGDLVGAASAASSSATALSSVADGGLTLLSGFLATTETAASAWLHLLTLDLFVARSVYLDALRTNVPAAHSLVLCCMFGPCGYLAHAATKVFCDGRRRRRRREGGGREGTGSGGETSRG
ncbi:uncharacterized protein MICPUCDRAFT_49783 [Micromonas pusilla CCMP1545]|uniref:Predicted protein n=1 Tax=Micromonas pusilla (strain CCMP1545) TaxID=564608 RepID=C1MGE6_MICPC|nr:uncharacterized protein MICPUCDRAFT_49783 [Micromonas pusilla CCMP1545]EEH60563.1 predicted protein [Micromonas pusilla CCMP1545]|eukprot:XP_003055311.1 predicted protein [Micromonas pusilla CCMP1545]